MTVEVYDYDEQVSDVYSAARVYVHVGIVVGLSSERIEPYLGEVLNG